jgi:hypothetical protein
VTIKEKQGYLSIWTTSAATFRPFSRDKIVAFGFNPKANWIAALKEGSNKIHLKVSP